MTPSSNGNAVLVASLSFFKYSGIVTDRMVNQFNAASHLREAATIGRYGRLQVQANGVTWSVYLAGTEIQYACHSLQTLEVLSQLAQKLGLAQLNWAQSIQRWSSGQPLAIALEELVEQQAITPETANQLAGSATEAALETLLWCEQASIEWLNISPAESQFLGLTGSQTGLDLLKRLEARLTAWQRLLPTIQSPDQCPTCHNLALLEQPVADGLLPTPALAAIVRLMQGGSLQELSVWLKQDVIKLSQLLHPYIRDGILHLGGAKEPLDLLPTIPTPTATSGHSANIPAHIFSTLSKIPGVPSAPVKQRYKVVCIDDSPTVLETMRCYLDPDRFEVGTVENAMTSMSALFDLKPDLILMDVSMPGIDGNRLCEILRRSSIFANVPIIMVSGNTGNLDKAKAKACGATDYLTKPFTQAELLHMIDHYLIMTPV
jgi:two-component system, chemotaxis family, response regulator PixG